MGSAGPGGRVLGGGQAAEGGVGPVGVVLDPPGLDHDLGHGQAGELLEVEQLVTHAAVEGLDVGVFPRRAGLDVPGPGAGQAAPLPQAPRDQLRAVVGAQVRGHAPLGDQAVEHGNEIISAAPAPHPHRERLAGVLIHDVGQLQPPPISGLVELEVDRPHMVGAGRAEPLGGIGCDAAALAGADRAAQALLAPQPLDALVVDPGPGLARLAAQHPPGHPPAPPGMCSGEVAEPLAQPRLVVWSGRSRAALRGAVLAGDAARAALGDPEAGLQVPHGPAAPLRGQKFPSASSLSMSMSNAWLATSRLSRAFSASSSLSRLAWLAFIPPYWPRQRFQVASEISSIRRISARSLPSLSSRSPSRTLRTACSGVCRCRFTVIVLLPTVWAIGLSQQVVTRPPEIGPPDMRVL